MMEYELRQSILRAPLGMDLSRENLRAERDQPHFGIFLCGEILVACVIAATLSEDEIKIRQMAVRSDLQGQGYGRALMIHVQDRLAAGGTRILSLHARSHVAGFYESLGFTRTGDEFTEIGIPHVKMVKSVPIKLSF
jgi:predicted GNAT family N-acyltransferase